MADCAPPPPLLRRPPVQLQPALPPLKSSVKLTELGFNTGRKKKKKDRGPAEFIPSSKLCVSRFLLSFPLAAIPVWRLYPDCLSCTSLSLLGSANTTNCVKKHFRLRVGQQWFSPGAVAEGHLHTWMLFQPVAGQQWQQCHVKPAQSCAALMQYKTSP